MDAITERIRELIDHTGLSHKEFASKIGISPAIISHILSGRNNPSLHVIQQITNVYTNVNIGYLLTGNGPFLKREEEALSPLSEGAQRVAPPGSTPPYKNTDINQESDYEEENIRQEPSDLSDIQTESFPESESPEEETNVKNRELTKVNKEAKEIERVIVFYTDKSMEEYRP